jgi:hypothetical protein
MWADHYAKLEDHFAQLLPLVTPLMSKPEVSFMREYLDAGEYGLALETIVDNLVMEGTPISRDTYQEIEALAQLMEGVVEDRLSGISIA